MNLFIVFICYFHEFDTERNKLSARFLAILTNFCRERNELLVRFLAVFTNLRADGTEHISRFFCHFHEFETRKELNYCSIFAFRT